MANCSADLVVVFSTQPIWRQSFSPFRGRVSAHLEAEFQPHLRQWFLLSTFGGRVQAQPVGGCFGIQPVGGWVSPWGGGGGGGAWWSAAGYFHPLVASAPFGEVLSILHAVLSVN